jgi:NADP-dependent 3-hydroxy acid dehydrogenase YdfG
VTNYLEGKVVIVTGAANGFGQLISDQAAALGANVVGADVNAAGLESVAETIRRAGGSFEPVTADVTVKEEVDAVAKRAIDRFGAIDVLVNNAGIMPLAFFADHAKAWAAWDRCIDINVKGVVHGIAAVYDQMTTQGRGHIINISSIYGNTGSAGSAVYSATKAAVNTLSESLRVESQGRIKVTIVRPTGVPGTGLGESVVSPAAAIGILGTNRDDYLDKLGLMAAGTLPAEFSDEDHPRNLSITPQFLAEQVIYTMNQPWGVSIAEITVRATGEPFIL